MNQITQRLINPLKSRKVRVALATIVAAYLAEWGLEVSEVVILGIIGTGMSVIWGIAHEDAGIKRRSSILDPGRKAPVSDAEQN